MVLGYARVSSTDQNLDRQLEAFSKVGVQKVYADKMSGKNFDRQEYQEMKQSLQKGDLLYIKSIDRLGRNYDMIIDEWRDITHNIGADIVVIDMPLLDTRDKDKGLTGKFISDLVFRPQNETILRDGDLSVSGTSMSFTCDCCGREVYSCNIVNGMKFCAKCYQETFGNQKKYVDMLHKETGELLVNLLAEKDKQIAELQKQLEEKEKRIKELDDWKANYGYTNYEDIYMLEDLQSRAFQSEDDTTVVNELLDYLNISDENEILPTIKQQLNAQPAEIV